MAVSCAYVVLRKGKTGKTLVGPQNSDRSVWIIDKISTLPPEFLGIQPVAY